MENQGTPPFLFQVHHPPSHPAVPECFAITWAWLGVAGKCVYSRVKSAVLVAWIVRGELNVKWLCLYYIAIDFYFFFPLLDVFLATWTWCAFIVCHTFGVAKIQQIHGKPQQRFHTQRLWSLSTLPGLVININCSIFCNSYHMETNCWIEGLPDLTALQKSAFSVIWKINLLNFC